MAGTRRSRAEANSPEASPGRVLVVGSINLDFVTRVARFPRPGETLLGSEYRTHFGGKGANQAVAAARMGADVSFLGRVGGDAFGERLRRGLADEGIDVGDLREVSGPSGAAFINVDDVGQNTIIVAPGANHRLEPEDLDPKMFAGASVVLLQYEIPVATVGRAIELGSDEGALVVVNAAPAGAVTLPQLQGTDLLVVNETEAQLLASGDGPALEIAEAFSLLAARLPALVLTLGAHGAMWRSGSQQGSVAPLPVDAVDTTAAGDAFVGAVAAELARGAGLAKAVELGNAAGALAVTREGAQPSLPSRREVTELLANYRSTNV